jgi:iron(III) transport system substrate-binding protein
MSYAVAKDAKEIRVITDRTESHLKPLFEYYKNKTGIKVKALFVGEGLLPRLRARPTEADVIITKTISVLATAKKKGLLQPFSSSKLRKKLRPQFRDPQNYYITISYRPRVIYYSKDRVKVKELSTYQSLISPKWKGRICIRSGYHSYNLSLFSQMAVTYGIEKTKKFIKGLHANLAQIPKGKDRDQIRAIYEGKCDIAIANSYYMGIMLSRKDQRDWALATKVFFPNQKEKGCFVLRSGAALTKAKRNIKTANKFLEFLIDDDTQKYICYNLYNYSINDKLPLPDVNKKLGNEQKEVIDGKFKANFVAVDKIEKYRTKIIKILDKINFDSK